MLHSSRSGWGGLGVRAPPLSPRYKSCSFQAIVRKNPYFEQIFGPPLGSKLHSAPLTKILDPRLSSYHGKLYAMDWVFLEARPFHFGFHCGFLDKKKTEKGIDTCRRNCCHFAAIFVRKVHKSKLFSRVEAGCQDVYISLHIKVWVQ